METNSQAIALPIPNHDCYCNWPNYDIFCIEVFLNSDNSREFSAENVIIKRALNLRTKFKRII